METPQAVKYNPSFKQEADKYMAECQQNKTLPTIKGFATRLGTDVNALWTWANKKKKDEQGKETEELHRPNFLSRLNKIKELEEKPREGRPLKFSSVESLQEMIDIYFQSCWIQKVDMFGNPIFLKDKDGKKTDEPVMIQFKPYTITGLAVSLDTSRATLMNYEEKDEFFNTIKRAKERCHNYAEESLFIGKNPTGAIFNLKNNYGWEDETHVDHTTKGKPINEPGILNGETKNVSENNSNS